MRFVYEVGGFPEASIPQDGKLGAHMFASIYNLFVDLMEATDNNFCYLRAHCRTRDASKWGKLEMLECEAPRSCFALEYVPAIQTHTSSLSPLRFTTPAFAHAFSLDCGVYPAAVHTLQDLAGGYAAALLMSTSKQAPLTVFRLDNGVHPNCRDSINSQASIGNDIGLQTPAIRLFGRSQFLTSPNLERYLLFARKVLSPAALLELQKRCVVLPNPIPFHICDEVHRQASETRDYALKL